MVAAPMMTLKDFESMLTRSLSAVHGELAIGLDKVGQLAEANAAELPGHYQPGWAPLAESTLADKEKQGFPVPSPLKRTGEMAESYRKDVDVAELEMVIGSESKIALYQEMGTVHIPPRPVCSTALKNSLPFATDVFGEIAVKLLTGKK